MEIWLKTLKRKSHVQVFRDCIVFLLNNITYKDMNKTTKSVAIAGMASLMMACSSTKKTDNNIVATRPAPGMEMDYAFAQPADNDMVAKNNTFAWNLFKQVQGMDNKVVSPISVTYLMGMLANGADGITQQEILNTLGWKGASVADVNAFCKAMMANAEKADPATVVNIANYIAVNKNESLKAPFVSAVENNFAAGVEKLDFSSPKALATINGWCKKHTDGMIPQIIDQVEPSALSYLLNAIYFNGAWTDKFNKERTKLENFRGFTRNIQKVQMMHRNGHHDYGFNDVCAALRLPYGNGSYGMTILLPNEGKSIDDVLKEMTPQRLQAMTQQMAERKVDVKLPRFTIETELGLNDVVAKLGAPSVFNPGKANFSKLADGAFSVSKMLQKSKIEVSEEGTKAAAVTAAVVMRAMAPDAEPEPVNFHCDRPFLYFITDSHTGAILFMGQFTGNND